ncbi:hypothetical protein Hypma_011245 [Hypsizygus marmoreus]|uniref:C2H2-type domain-containing protein n=1 Tax=Hypsizygus marmoreus TaxID=39966 RepID=A0A369JS20_HYPMA|nr:hypothetical protein Hypma_011245 [Hypsizygus marmoreus]
MAQCQYCQGRFSTSTNVRRHQQQATACRQKLEQQFGDLLRRRRLQKSQPSVPPQNAPDTPILHDDGADVLMEDISTSGNIGSTSEAHQDVPDVDTECDAILPAPRMVEVEDIDAPRKTFRTLFPANGEAGKAFGSGKTAFEHIHDDQVLRGAEILGPFRDDEEWNLAKWLIKNVGHNQADVFLKLPIITGRAKPSFQNKAQFLGKIDELPGGVNWLCVDLDVEGDIPDLATDPSGKTMKREATELWYRDPVECVEELMGNPAFRDVMKYAPEQLFKDEKGDIRIVNEMWTATWWWEIQKRLPPGVTIAPLIISSDKTHLSNFRGDQSAWPVYLTIGNISKEKRREVSSHATVLLGYLPIPKFDCFSKDSRSLAKYRLFHTCMGLIMKTVAKAGTTGKKMVCSDNMIRDVRPIFAAYVADYPEQCLVGCCMENRCPICTVPPNDRGNHQPHSKRDEKEALFYLQRKNTGESDTAFKDHGMRAVYPPFWAQLPHSDIFSAFTPDLLHQVHKGVFKDHLVKWCTEIIGKNEVDARFRALPSHPGLRHFKNGISHVSQWTGTEHKEMEKVFLGLVASNAHGQVIKAVHALIDFVYYASLQSHTSHTLLALRQALDDFHANKQIFIDLEGRSQLHFNIPKVHSLEHYEYLISLFGSADGFNTESPERLHIDYAKNAYRASNRKDYIAQMTKWLTRQESVDRFSAYLDWAALPFHPKDPNPDPNTEELVIESTRQLFSVAKRPPPTCRRTVASFLMDPAGHNAPRFLDALSSYLLQQGSPFKPHDFDVFNLWKQLVFRLPNIPEVGQRHTKNVVRAIGPTLEGTRNSGRRQASEPAYLDFAMVRTGEVNAFTGGTSLEGLRIAQVRVIFELPHHYPVKAPLPLAYIEWFTPLRSPDPLTGYYHIARSTRRNGPYAEIITVDRIVRNAMLIPINHGNSKKYMLNSHIDGHMFCMTKLGLKDCISC